ncbi:MAG TPA: hypothetical protein VGC77_09310 [Rhodopseudomonas sp.]|uniref:hypothetical protein n=1 Tax=Rhodopseudomonas sp. TaxID=1078 RepID=UPI002ED9E775
MSGRVQVPELAGPVPLQGGNVPGDTFTGAPRPEIDNNLTHIADALSGLNSSLTAWGSQAAAQQKAQASAMETARVEGRLAGMTQQDVLNYRRSPDYQPINDPHARGVEAGAYGQAFGGTAKSDLDAQIAAGKLDLSDPKNDPTGLLRQRAAAAAQEITKRYSSDPVAYKLAMQGLKSSMAPLYTQYGAQAMKAQSDALMASNTNTARKFMEQAGEGDVTPEQVGKAWSSITTELGPKGSANIPNATMKAERLDILERWAADPDKAKLVPDLLKQQNPGADGKTLLPSLQDDLSGNVVEKVTNIRLTAQKTFAKNWSRDQNTAKEDQAFEALRRQDGSIAAVQPERKQNEVTKEWETIGADAQTNAAKRYFTWSQQDAATGRNPQIVLDREIAVAQHSNIPIPHLKQALDDSVNRAIGGDFSTNFQNRQAVLGAYTTWQGMANNNRAWAEEKMGLTPATKEFYSVMDVATGSMHLDADQAMDLAANVVKNPMAKNDPEGLNKKLASISSTVASLPPDGSWFSSDAYNAGFARQKVDQIAKLLGKSGQITAEKAVELATDFVKKNTFQVNGSALSTVPNMATSDAQKFLDAKIDQLLPAIQSRHDYKGATKSDIGVYDAGDGTYGLRDKRTGLEIRLPKREPDGTEWRGKVTITPQELMGMRDKATADQRNSLQDQNSKNAVKAVIDAHNHLDTQQMVLDKGALGGAYREAQQKRINDARAKLPAKPEVPAEPSAPGSHRP